MNKSEELAKLLRIEPKNYNCNWFNTHLRNIENKKDCPKFCKDHCQNNIYPNFENSNNFMKLIECFIKTNTVISFVNEFGQVEVGIGQGNNLIESCIDFINEVKQISDDDNKELLQYLQQQAQQTEWEY